MKKTNIRCLLTGICVIFVLSLFVVLLFNIRAYTESKNRTNFTFYGCNYPDFSYDLPSGESLNVPALETRDLAQRLKVISADSRIKMHFSDGFLAKDLINSLSESDVIFIMTHGTSGLLTCIMWDYRTNKLMLKSYFTGVKYSDEPYIRTFSDIPTTKKISTRFVLFGSCKSGITSQIGYGNMVEQAVANGVKCAMGFKGELDDIYAKSFDERMLYYGSVSKMSIKDCIDNSLKDVYNQYHEYGGTDDYLLVGDSSLKMFD